MMKSKRILVTGGTGFVGSYILRYLVNSGYAQVSCLKRNNSKINLISDISDKISFRNADMNDILSLENAVKDIDIVIHTAAVVSFKTRDRAKMMKVNVEGTSNLVNICIDKKIDKFIHISSIASLGRSISGKTINEKTQWNNSKTNSDYAISKYLSEMEVWRGFAEGLPVAVLNPSLILGAGFWDIGTGELFKKVYKGLRFYPTGTNGFVDVRDVAKMSILLMEKNIVGERFICSSENIKLKDVFSSMAISMDKTPPSIELSSIVVSIAAGILNLINLIPGYSSNLTSQSLKNASFDSIYDNTKSIKELGYNYIPIDRTIEETSILFKESFSKGIKFSIFKV